MRRKFGVNMKIFEHQWEHTPLKLDPPTQSAVHLSWITYKKNKKIKSFFKWFSISMCCEPCHTSSPPHWQVDKIKR